MNTKITLAHGNGGKLTHDLIIDRFLPLFSNEHLLPLADSALLDAGGMKLAFTTDSYVVNPIFFPGGDIGRLSVCGTVNDLVVMGATPRYLSLALIIEEGLDLEILDRVLASVRDAANEVPVQVVTGDTKVVGKGSADGIFINTAGIGLMEDGDPGFGRDRLVEGDRVICTGTIGDHGMAIFTARGDFPLRSGLISDCAPLAGLLLPVLREAGKGRVKVVRDPTRGGLATTLNEFVKGTRLGIVLEEARIPVREEVRVLCEMSGYDPLYVANEGKAVLVVERESSEEVLSALRRHPLGAEARIIGEVAAEPRGTILLKTRAGGKRIVDMLQGDMLPRIC
jgi:hydrogenase expression/formation protein HypE